jgi:flagellar basal-body rod protein FlgB
MDPIKTDLFGIAEKRLAWLSERQGVLASNIANANTPGFRGADVQSFASVLGGMTPVTPLRTQSAHMAGTIPSSVAGIVQDSVTARSVDGNSIALDRQLTKVADTESAQSLVSTIWKNYMGMFNTVLGKAG